MSTNELLDNVIRAAHRFEKSKIPMTTTQETSLPHSKPTSACLCILCRTAYATNQEKCPICRDMSHYDAPMTGEVVDQLRAKYFLLDCELSAVRNALSEMIHSRNDNFQVMEAKIDRIHEELTEYIGETLADTIKSAHKSESGKGFLQK